MRFTRVAAASGIALLALSVSVGSASAHVTIPDPGEKGGFSIVTFNVPNERSDASTTSLEVKLPEDSPLPFVSVQPKPGWTAETTMRTLDEPIDAFGEEVTEVVDTVTWSGGEIAPGEFDTLSLSVGPLPDDVDELVFPAIQTYSSGEEVAWIEVTPEGGEQPENPAPVLILVAAGEGGEDATAAAQSDDEQAGAGSDESADDDSVDTATVIALIVSVIAIALAIYAVATSRRTK